MSLKVSLLLVALVAAAAPAAGAPAFDSGSIAPGASWSHTFTEVNEAGHSYHCHPHPWMTGMVHVQPDGDGATETHEVEIVEGADSDDWGYSVEHLVVEVGDTVVWTNVGEAVHTVTEVQSGHDHDHGHHDDAAATDGNDAPGPAWVGVLLGVATVLALTLLRRR